MRWGIALWAVVMSLTLATAAAQAQGGQFSNVTAIRACNQSSKVIMVAKAAATGQQ